MVVCPFTFCVTNPVGETSTSNLIQLLLGSAGYFELMQCVVISLPSITTFVPGEHMLPLKRVCPGAGPRSCASTETGKLSSTAIVLGSCEKIMTPEFAMAQFGVSAG